MATTKKSTPKASLEHIENVLGIDRKTSELCVVSVNTDYPLLSRLGTGILDGNEQAFVLRRYEFNGKNAWSFVQVNIDGSINKTGADENSTPCLSTEYWHKIRTIEEFANFQLNPRRRLR